MQSASANMNDTTAPEPEPTEPNVAQLQNALAAANNEIASLQKSLEDQQQVQNAYDDALGGLMSRIRTWREEQQQYISSLHRHYVDIVQQSRQETMDAQLTHQAWQAGLQRVSQGVRESLKAREEEGAPWKKRIAALKSENKLLRKKVGWEPPVDSDSESDDDEVNEEEKLRQKLRPTKAPEENRAVQAERDAVDQEMRDSQEKLRREMGQQGQGQGQGPQPPAQGL